MARLVKRYSNRKLYDTTAKRYVSLDVIADMIREGKLHQIPSAMQTGQQAGMQTIEMALADLTKRGLLEREAATPKPPLNGGVAAAGAAH